MADRKAWELTDDELAGGKELSTPQMVQRRAIATAAARKALEWAAKHVESRAGLRGTGAWTLCDALSHEIRKELSDG